MLGACGGGGTSGLSLSNTDVPVADADIFEVWVRFTHEVSDNSDPNDFKPCRDIELKSLVGGKT